MDASRLRMLSRIQHGHFWFAGRDLLLDHFTEQYVPPGSLVLEAGAGTGRWLDRLNARGYRAYGIDLSAGTSTGRLAKGDVHRLPFADGIFAAVFLLDVLEHVDDRLVLGEIARVLQHGGHLILSVPAYPWLWSYRDDAAGHLRRYTPRSLRHAVGEAGLELRERRFYQFFLFPVLAASRLTGRSSPWRRDLEDSPPRWLNGPLSRLNRFEAVCSRHLSWPWGSSILAVCRHA